jgi:glycosyltransferase involved in cell wall biosynthesis
VEAARTTARVVGDAKGRVLLHHHDLPWQRRSYKHFEGEFPPQIDGALHVTINLRSRRELQARGYDAHAVHNYFDLDPPPGDRAATRAGFGFADDDLVVFQPARAIERKNVPGGVLFTARLGQLLTDSPVRYWLSGPAEDGYAPTLERVLDRAGTPVTVGRAPSAADAYAAADVVVYPSTWEGFGNPTIESIAARRPCAAFRYPVLAEILATGVQLFSTDQPEAVAKFMCDSPEARERYYDLNLRRARLSFSIDELPAAIEQVLAS